MPSFLGMRGTGDWVSNQRPENWRETLLYLYPNGKAPLTAILSMMGSEVTNDSTYHWWQKALPDQRATITGIYTDAGLSSAYASGGVAGNTLYVKMSEVDSKKFIASHAVLLIPASVVPAQFSARVMAKVTATTQAGASSYLTVKLLEADDNGTGGVDLSDATVALVAGTINPEGGTSPTSLMYDPEESYNYTQIFRNSLEHTRTAQKTRLRTGDQVQQAKRECLELHGIEQEKAFIFGVRSLGVGSNNKPERTTGGILSSLSTNISDYTQLDGSGTWLSGGEDWLDDMLEQIFRYGDTEKIGFCGSGALKGINRLAKNRGTFELTAMKASYGIKVLEWVTAFGTLYLKTHPLFTYEPTLRNSILIVQPNLLVYRPLKDSDTKYLPNRQANDLDGEKSEYLTEAGLETHFEQAHGWLQGVGQDNV